MSRSPCTSPSRVATSARGCASRSSCCSFTCCCKSRSRKASAIPAILAALARLDLRSCRPQPRDLRSRQSLARKPRVRAIPRDRAGRHAHRLVYGRRHRAHERAAVDDVGGWRGGGGLRPAGHARESLFRSRDSDREAVSGLDSGSPSATAKARSRRSPGVPPSCAPRRGSS